MQPNSSRRHWFVALLGGVFGFWWAGGKTLAAENGLATPPAEKTYTYDLLESSVSASPLESITYTYDAAGRLRRAEYGPSSVSAGPRE